MERWETMALRYQGLISTQPFLNDCVVSSHQSNTSLFDEVATLTVEGSTADGGFFCRIIRGRVAGAAA